MLVKKGRHSEISMNYKLKILAKKVNLLNLRSLVSLKRPQIKFYFTYIYLGNRSAVHGKFRSICIKNEKYDFSLLV